MQRCSVVTLLAVSLVLVTGVTVSAEEGVLEYPCYLLDAYSADNACWRGMLPDGSYPYPVDLERWLTGPPPSERSGVTIPIDHWIDLQFCGRIVDGPGDDILLVERGRAGEAALVFVTDGFGRDYLVGIAEASDTGGELPTEIGFDISDISAPFAFRSVRIAALDTGGQSPGFDIGNLRARVASSCEREVACNPRPVDGARNVDAHVVLSWSPGRFADEHAVYIGRTPADAEWGGMADDAARLQDASSYDPCGLELGETYYWRVVEVDRADADSPWVGDLWSFTVAECAVVDDFESYNSTTNKLLDTWAAVGARFVFISNNLAQGCGLQSMGLEYKYSQSVHTEVVRTFDPPLNLTSGGARVLELYFRGTSGNDTDCEPYVAIADAEATVAIPYEGDASDFAKQEWQPWRIELQNVAEVNLETVKALAMGIRTSPADPTAWGMGMLFFDEIKLCGSRCIEENRSVADLNCDCTVDFGDFSEMAGSWGQGGETSLAVSGPNAPIAWYEFDGNANDSAGGAHGNPAGDPKYVTGIDGEAISFDGHLDSVSIPGAAGLFSGISTGITIAFWQYGVDSGHRNDTVCCSDYGYGVADPAIAINLGCWREPGRYNWDCGEPWSFDNRLTGEHQYESEWSGRWNHWAFTKDTRVGAGPEKGRMRIFLNGRLYDSRTGTTSPIAGISSFEIGSGWYGGYDGLIDDFRIYDYALSEAEVAYVATNGTGIFAQPILSPADLDQDDYIDFGDLAIIADSWLQEHLWP